MVFCLEINYNLEFLVHKNNWFFDIFVFDLFCLFSPWQKGKKMPLDEEYIMLTWLFDVLYKFCYNIKVFTSFWVKFLVKCRRKWSNFIFCLCLSSFSSTFLWRYIYFIHYKLLKYTYTWKFIYELLILLYWSQFIRSNSTHFCSL